MCCGQFATFRITSACVIHVLHALQFAELTFLALNGILAVFPVIFRCIEVPIDRAICFPTQICVANRFYTFACPNSGSFMSIYA